MCKGIFGAINRKSRIVQRHENSQNHGRHTCGTTSMGLRNEIVLIPCKSNEPFNTAYALSFDAPLSFNVGDSSLFSNNTEHNMNKVKSKF